MFKTFINLPVPQFTHLKINNVQVIELTSQGCCEKINGVLPIMDLELAYIKWSVNSGRSLVAQWVKDPALSVLSLGHCCGVGLISGPGTSTCCGHSQEKKKDAVFDF